MHEIDKNNKREDLINKVDKTGPLQKGSKQSSIEKDDEEGDIQAQRKKKDLVRDESKKA